MGIQDKLTQANKRIEILEEALKRIESFTWDYDSEPIARKALAKSESIKAE